MSQQFVRDWVMLVYMSACIRGFKIKEMVDKFKVDYKTTLGTDEM